jgi:hypothetical protein
MRCFHSGGASPQRNVVRPEPPGTRAMSAAAGARRTRAPPFVDPSGYARHRPESTLLYRLVEQHHPAFRALRAETGRPLPGPTCSRNSRRSWIVGAWRRGSCGCVASSATRRCWSRSAARSAGSARRARLACGWDPAPTRPQTPSAALTGHPGRNPLARDRWFETPLRVVRTAVYTSRVHMGDRHEAHRHQAGAGVAPRVGTPR